MSIDPDPQDLIPGRGADLAADAGGSSPGSGTWRRTVDPDGDDEAPERFGAYREMSRVMGLAFLRDKGALFFLILFPVMFLLLFGTLFRGTTSVHAKVAQVGAIALLDSLHGAERTQLDAVLTVVRMGDESAALAKVRDGDLDGLIEQGPGNALVLRYSTADTTRAATVQAITNGLLQAANQEATGQPPKYTLAASQVEDHALKPIQYLTPGLLGWAIATGAVFSSSLTLVTLRKRQVLRRVQLAPVSALTVVTSRIVVTTMIALVQTALFLAIAVTPFFGLRLSGSWWLVIPLVLCATMAFMSVGMFAGAIASSEQTANGLSQLLVLPMSLLSGSFFSLDNAPGWLQALSKLMPLRYLVTSSESVLSRGGGLMDALPTMGGLLLFAAAVSALSWRFFSWQD